MRTVEYNLDSVKSSLDDLHAPVLHPVFIIVSGLPGTGKSYLSRKLVEKMPAGIIESDSIRKLLWHRSVYDAAESAELFKICHTLIEDLLKQGISVIFDATNLTEYHREHLYHIGEKTNARILIVVTKASEDVVKRRLDDRKSGLNRSDKSDADWSVYRKMIADQQKIGRNFIFADTSSDIDTIIGKIIRMIKK